MGGGHFKLVTPIHEFRAKVWGGRLLGTGLCLEFYGNVSYIFLGDCHQIFHEGNTTNTRKTTMGSNLPDCFYHKINLEWCVHKVWNCHVKQGARLVKL